MIPKYILSFLSCLGICAISFAQVSLERNVIGSAGMDYKNNQIQLSATVGEAIVTTVNANNIILTQGFQQPEKEDFTSSYRSQDLIETWSVFPNPAYERVYLDITTKKEGDYTIEIFDVLGKKWKSQTNIDLDVGINRRLNFELSTVPDGHYFIRIVDGRGSLAGSLRFLVQK